MRARTLALALLAFVPGCSGDDGPAQPRNLLLISLDSTRRDMLGPYGRRPLFAPDEVVTPHLDRLADGGVVFESAYSTTSWTLASHMSILTGQPELVHAVDLDYHRLDPARPLLAEVLVGHGYRTAGFISGPYLEPSFGFDRGFLRYEPSYGTDLTEAARQGRAARSALDVVDPRTDPNGHRAATQENKRAQNRVDKLSHRDISSEIVADKAVEELRAMAADERPFFLFAHFFDPHYDYVPPAPWDERFDPDYDGPVSGENFMLDEHIATFDPSDRDRRVQQASERDMQHIAALYEGEMRWTDAQVGRILDELDALGLADDTLVVVLADHGDEFFEHGNIGHRHSLYEEVVRVPLLLRLPGEVAAGVRVSGTVSTIDVFATALELLGVPTPSDVTSRSLVPYLEGDEPTAPHVVFGRLVRPYKLEMLVPTRVGDVRVEAQQVRILETYVEGALKITREFTRVHPTGDVPPAALEALKSNLDVAVGRERLVWFDLATGAEPALDEQSSDFSDARARAVLERFHGSYLDLLERRGRATISTDDGGVGSMLQGLGYVGDDAPDTVLGSDEFILSPPGREILSRDG